MTLTELKNHKKAVIKDIPIANIPIKLFEMGCHPGSIVTMISKAPLNGPLYIKIDNTCLVLRKNIASYIKVEPC